MKKNTRQPTGKQAKLAEALRRNLARRKQEPSPPAPKTTANKAMIGAKS